MMCKWYQLVMISLVGPIMVTGCNFVWWCTRGTSMYRCVSYDYSKTKNVCAGDYWEAMHRSGMEDKTGDHGDCDELYSAMNFLPEKKFQLTQIPASSEEAQRMYGATGDRIWNKIDEISKHYSISIEAMSEQYNQDQRVLADFDAAVGAEVQRFEKKNRLPSQSELDVMALRLGLDNGRQFSRIFTDGTIQWDQIVNIAKSLGVAPTSLACHLTINRAMTILK